MSLAWTGALKVSGVPVNFYFSIVFGYGNDFCVLMNLQQRMTKVIWNKKLTATN